MRTKQQLADAVLVQLHNYGALSFREIAEVLYRQWPSDMDARERRRLRAACKLLVQQGKATSDTRQRYDYTHTRDGRPLAMRRTHTFYTATHHYQEDQ